ncbi:MAG: YjgP/YjgQ family permease [Planctomycetota bacterium]|nr:MAG: YjgP/YjgQ family permease [Planctomycetota bacterium]
MRLLTRYVLREIGGIFLVTLVALTSFMLLVGAVQAAIQEGLGAKQIVLALPYLLPNALMFAIPGTMLFAVSMVYGRMSSANEIIALKSLGISPMAVIWPALGMAVLLSFATTWLNDLAMSWGYHGVKQVAIDSAEEIAYSILRSRKSFKGDAFEVTVRDVVGHKLIGPVFRLPSGTEGEPLDITAASAEIRSVPGSGKLTLVLHDFVVDGPDLHAEHPGETVEREVEIKPHEDKNPSPSHLALREIPDAIVRQVDLIERLEEKAVAFNGLAVLTGDFDRLSPDAWREEAKNLQFQRYQLYRMHTEPPRRWSTGFSCLCFALVGTAMAIRMRNSDVLTSFALCFLPILLIYYPLLAFGLDRAKAGEIHPYCVWLANTILALWGLWLLRRVMRY